MSTLRFVYLRQNRHFIYDCKKSGLHNIKHQLFAHKLTPAICVLLILLGYSKPSPPESDELKKQNTMTSPIHHNIVTAMDSTTHQGLTSQIHVTSPNTQQYPPPSTQPILFTLQPTDLSNIVLQLKFVLRDEITNIIKCFQR